jgi:hypothetical protein
MKNFVVISWKMAFSGDIYKLMPDYTAAYAAPRIEHFAEHN